MAGTIGSVVNRANMPKLVRSHAVGLWLGGLTMALALTLLGALVRPAVLQLFTPLKLLAVPVLLGWAARAMGRGGLPFPSRAWQVPEHWRYTLPPAMTLGAYGYILGLGWLTHIILPTYWILFAGTIAVASVPIALAAWTAFALGRFLTAWRGARLVASGNDDVTPHNLRYTRKAAAGLLAFTAIALSLQVV